MRVRRGPLAGTFLEGEGRFTRPGIGAVMTDPSWVQEFPSAVTVLDAEGIILAMNDKAAATFAADGGAALIGTNALDCHPEPSRSKLSQMLRAPRVNIYTIEKAGTRKLICQSPWYRDGKFSGIVEIAIVLQADVPHFVRD